MSEIKSPKHEPMKIEIYGYEVVTKVVKPASDKISRVYLPKAWAGKQVKIVLMEELEDVE